jgi:proteic killer suppression protein
MIRTFKSRALAELWSTGGTRRIDRRLHKRILLRLDRLDAAGAPHEMQLPGFDFHELKGVRPTRYTIHINGPWCLTFEFEGGDAWRVDLEQYH